MRPEGGGAGLGSWLLCRLMHWCWPRSRLPCSPPGGFPRPPARSCSCSQGRLSASAPPPRRRSISPAAGGRVSTAQATLPYQAALLHLNLLTAQEVGRCGVRRGPGGTVGASGLSGARETVRGPWVWGKCSSHLEEGDGGTVAHAEQEEGDEDGDGGPQPIQLSILGLHAALVQQQVCRGRGSGPGLLWGWACWALGSPVLASAPVPPAGAPGLGLALASPSLSRVQVPRLCRVWAQLCPTPGTRSQGLAKPSQLGPSQGAWVSVGRWH